MPIESAKMLKLRQNGFIPISSPYHFYQLSPIYCQLWEGIYKNTYKTKVFNENMHKKQASIKFEWFIYALNMV